MSQVTSVHTGGHVVVESLEALGADVAFGIPGTHTLSIWDGLRTSPIRSLCLRTELNAGFAAEGYARVSGRPAPLLLTTGPGALMSLAALMEAAKAHTPVVAIASQIPRELIGRGRGYLHELDDQPASFAPIVKWTARAEHADDVPPLLAEAWQRAQTPPSGPVFVEIPVDILRAPVDTPRVDDLSGDPMTLVTAPDEALAQAGRLLLDAERPVVWAGGGVLRSSAWEELATLAERLRAPVATTYMGKGAFPEDHPLAAGSSCDEPPFRELLTSADVLLCVGTELGAETTGHFALRFSGKVIHIDAAPERIGVSYPALALVGDAKQTLEALLELVPERPADGASEAMVAALRARIQDGLVGQPLERGLLEAIRTALPRHAIHTWDMTMLAYWAAAYFPALAPRRFLYPLGSGTLGYAWPAALGAAAAEPDTPTLAVVGDGGILYGLAELLAARQHGLSVALLVIDDGGYGILRRHQRVAYSNTYAVDLTQPDFAALCVACEVPARTSCPERLAEDLDWALGTRGPASVVLPAELKMFDAAAGWSHAASE